MPTIPDAESSKAGSGDVVQEYAYVILVRPSMQGMCAEVIDISHWCGKKNHGAVLADLEKTNAVLRRMGEEEVYDLRGEKALAGTINMLWLRARFNNAEGPFLVKSEVPIEGDTWDTLVRDERFMERLRKEGKL